MEKPSANFVVEIFGRAVLLIFYVILLRNHGNAYMDLHKVSSLLYIGIESLIVGLVFFRAPPVRFSIAPFDWLVAILGTLAPILIQPTNNPDGWAGICVQIVGIVITLTGIISLNRSFGIVPAERDIKTDGMYKAVRHPLYCGYLISNIGVLANHFTWLNLLYVIIGGILQVIRILREEKFLSQNENYRQYMQLTRWRLIPYIW